MVGTLKNKLIRKFNYKIILVFKLFLQGLIFFGQF